MSGAAGGVPSRGGCVVGLTGPNAAGKGEVAAALKAAGFAYHSLSDIVREEALRLGRGVGRDALILTGTELRRAFGPGVLAERILPRLGPRDVVDSIRNPAEVEVLRRRPGFVLVGVDAPAAVRFGRARLREGRGDALSSLEAFLAKEAEENTSDPAAQRLAATFALADRVLANASSLEALREAVAALVAELESRAGGA
jgi:dephospho-CoA kinase